MFTITARGDPVPHPLAPRTMFRMVPSIGTMKVHEMIQGFPLSAFAEVLDHWPARNTHLELRLHAHHAYTLTSAHWRD